MSSNNTQNFYKKLNSHFKNNVKLSSISKSDFLNKIIIIVTNEDKVYIFSKNAVDNSFLIFSDNDIEHKIKESFNEELSNRGIIDIKSSSYHTIARTDDGKLYCWGKNLCGVLGNGSNDENTYKPELNEELNDKYIIEMSCGEKHSLVLTNDGQVYGWGSNEFGQIGNRKSGKKVCQLTPYFIDELKGENVKSISCGYKHSLALTAGGTVYSWGYNRYKQLGRKTYLKPYSSCPKLIELKNETFEKISCGRLQSVLLSSKGNLYVFGYKAWGEYVINTENHIQLLPFHSDKFTDIASHWDYSFSAVLSRNGSYYIWGESSRESKQIQFNSFNEIFYRIFDITYNAIKGELIQFNDNFIRNGFYVKNFKEIKRLGEGDYGIVNKVSRIMKYESNFGRRFITKYYAIKIIELSMDLNNSEELKNQIGKELENICFLKELNNIMVLEYYDLWFENTTPLNYNKQYVYIQMELCDTEFTLIMQEIKNRTLTNNNSLAILDLFISCQVFIQILEGVNYLHTRSPQIIHRNLKPDNILIKIRYPDKSVIKIAGMGLICLHDNNTGVNTDIHSQDIGDHRYAAPEVLDSTNYDTRADIYSIGNVLKELFITENNCIRYFPEDSQLLFSKCRALSGLLDKMTEENVSIRSQSCQQILNDQHLWALDVNEILVKKEMKNFSKGREEQFKKSYFYKLINLFMPESLRNSDTNENFLSECGRSTRTRIDNLLPNFQI